MSGWKHGLCDQTSWVWMPTPPLTSFVILDKLFNLSVPLFSSMVKCTAVTHLHWVLVRVKWVSSQVLVCLGCWNKTPWMGGLSRHLFLTVLEGGKSKIKVPTDSVSWKTPLPGLHTAFYLQCHYVVKRWRGTALSSFKDTNPTMRALPAWPPLNLKFHTS